MPVIHGEKGDYKDYDEYLQSDEWKEKSRNVKEFYGNQCIICGMCGDLEVHHVTYKNVGHEHSGEIFPLCNTCHEELTRSIKKLKEELCGDISDMVEIIEFAIYKIIYGFQEKLSLPIAKELSQYYETHMNMVNSGFLEKQENVECFFFNDYIYQLVFSGFYKQLSDYLSDYAYIEFPYFDEALSAYSGDDPENNLTLIDHYKYKAKNYENTDVCGQLQKRKISDRQKKIFSDLFQDYVEKEQKPLFVVF